MLTITAEEKNKKKEDKNSSKTVFHPHSSFLPSFPPSPLPFA
jgi:hypothetical protein